eukprot:SAG22_NODE_116_length_19306_cov_247.696517_15_plen_59_part_00
MENCAGRGAQQTRTQWRTVREVREGSGRGGGGGAAAVCGSQHLGEQDEQLAEGAVVDP